jgi:8-oxo-dGTP pyrophosphatase MutT (NUDIX family)
MAEVVSSSCQFRGKIVSVRVDEVRLSDGRMVWQEVVEHRQSVTLIALDDQNHLVLTRQYRHPVGESLLETPAGSIDGNETPAEAANRELIEEVGLGARDLLALGSFYLAPGWATEYMHAFLARDLYPAQGRQDDDEQIEVVRLPVDEWEACIARGEIRDGKSLTAWHLALPHLRK